MSPAIAPDSQPMARILLYTGKGGVGKTSVAAATALACAARGQRTMILSTDIAHSLGDVFGVELGPEPVQIGPNLWGQESDVFHNVSRYWGRIQAYAASVLRWRGLDDVLAEEMTVLPGMDEVGSLLWIADHHDSNLYDVIVVDAAPTGETLRLLSLPEAAKWWMEKVEPIGRRLRTELDLRVCAAAHREPALSVPPKDVPASSPITTALLGQALDKHPALLLTQGRGHARSRDPIPRTHDHNRLAHGAPSGHDLSCSPFPLDLPTVPHSQ